MQSDLIPMLSTTSKFLKGMHVANDKVKIHFVGYSSRYNEWHSVSELVDKAMGVEEDIAFSLHKEFASQIKANLGSSRKSSPEPILHGH